MGDMYAKAGLLSVEVGQRRCPTELPSVAGISETVKET
jgi:hypothetical protein